MMTTKEWLLIGLPILLNGFFIYVIQYCFLNRLERNLEKKEGQFLLLEEFQKELNKVLESCAGFKHAVQEPSTVPIDIAFNNEIRSVKLLHTYFVTHKDILPEYSKTVENMLEESLQVFSELVRIQTELNGQLTNETFLKGATHQNKLVELLEDTINNCGRDLEKVYS